MPENTSGITRREFLTKVAAVGGLAVASHIPHLEAKAEPEHVSLVEGLNHPTKLIDQFITHIKDQGVQDSEDYKIFIDNFDLENSKNRQEVRRYRAALDYAFGDRNLGKAIIKAVDADLAQLFPNQSLESRLQNARGGSTQTLSNVIFTFSGLERRSRYDLSVEDNTSLGRDLMEVTRWVTPMLDFKDYKTERIVYSQRAKDLKSLNRLYDNTSQAWGKESVETQVAVNAILEIEESYFPGAGAGLWVIAPGDYPYHVDYGMGVEEVYLDANSLSIGIRYGDLGQIEYWLGSLLHEQSHQCDRESLDFTQLYVFHPEDMIKDYEVRNQTLGQFRKHVLGMNEADIRAFCADPSVNIKFSHTQFARNQDEAEGAFEEMNTTYELIKLISETQGSYIEDVGLNRNLFSTQLQESLISNMRDLPSENLLRIHSQNNFACYTLLTKLEQSGALAKTEYAGLRRFYPYIKELVESQVVHATLGPPGSYIGVLTANVNVVDNPVVGIDKLKQRAIDARNGNSFFTQRSNDLVDFMFDQTIVSMDAQAKLWGGTGLRDYSAFAHEVIGYLGVEKSKG